MKNKKTLKNIVIINDFDYVEGGASKVAIQTANMLASCGDDYDVYYFSAVHGVESTLINKVKKVSTNQKEALNEKNKIKGAFNGIYNRRAKKELKKLLKTLDRNETVIHVHGWTKALSCSIFSVIFKMNFPVVMTLHDYFTACPNGGYFNYRKNEVCEFKPLSWKCVKCNCDSRNYGFKIYRLLRQFVQNKVVKLNKRINNVISISEFSERILKKTLDSGTNIYRVYNPIEINKTRKAVDFNKNKYYLYVGRVSKEKGVDIFCKAISELGLEGVVVGDGDQKEKLEKEYPNIKFAGWKKSHEVKDYMLKAKALVFPSRWYETMGMTVIEAQNIGLPTIVSKNTAASEFVKDDRLKYNNYNELKRCVLEIEAGRIKKTEGFVLANDYEKDIKEIFSLVLSKERDR